MTASERWRVEKEDSRGGTSARERGRGVSICLDTLEGIKLLTAMYDLGDGSVVVIQPLRRESKSIF